MRSNDTWQQRAVIEELDELGYGQLEMVGVARQDGRLPTNLGVPADLELKGLGVVLYEKMHLDDIPEADLAELASLLD